MMDMRLYKYLRKTRDSGSATRGWDDPITILPSGDPWVEVPVPTDAEKMIITWDLTVSVDGGDIVASLEIDSTWYNTDAAHTNQSNSSSAAYGGSVAQKVANPGNDTGESVSQCLILAGLQSTSLYPTMLLCGGYMTTDGTVRMSQGARARKTAGAITAIRLTPASGTVSGRVVSQSFNGA